ncbi:MAG: sugar transferase [Anaerolineales bacterium]
MDKAQRVGARDLPRPAFRLRAEERRLILLLGDLVAASIATLIALAGWAQFDWLGFTQEFIRSRAGWFVFTPIVWVALLVGLYDLHRAGSWRQTWTGVLKAAAAGAVIYLIAYFTLQGSLARRGVLYFLVFAVVFTLLWRRLYIAAFRTWGLSRRALVVGAGESGKAILRVLRSLPNAPLEVVAFVDDDPAKRDSLIEGVPVIGGNRELLSRVERDGVTDVVVAIIGPMNGEMFQVLLDAQERGVEITRMPVAYEEWLGRVPIQHLESDWILRSFVDEVQTGSLYELVRRAVDIAGALFGLALFFLVLPWAALAIALESGRPIFFAQKRLGRGGRPYPIVKLRTMRSNEEEGKGSPWPSEDDIRMTRVGWVLRRTHLDEFPQFWNVLRGEMSLVGPRPEQVELVAELEREIPFYRARLLVKPGLTGWAQVNYGKGASVEGSAEKLEYDLYYIKHRGFLLDLWIILRTIGAIIGMRGV